MKTILTRRTFLEKSSKGIVVLTSIPHLFKDEISSVFAMPNAEEMNLMNYYDHFGVTESDIREVMTAALSQGGDYCDLYFQHKISNSIGLEDKSVNRASSNVDFGVGIRVLKGDQTGFSFTEEITTQAMKLAAKTAANIANSSVSASPAELKLHKTKNYYPI